MAALRVTATAGAGHCASVQAHRTGTTSEPCYKLWALGASDVSIPVKRNKCNTPVGVTDGGKAMPLWGQVLYLGNLRLLLSFAVNLKLYLYKIGHLVQLPLTIFLLRACPTGSGMLQVSGTAAVHRGTFTLIWCLLSYSFLAGRQRLTPSGALPTPSPLLLCPL